MSSTDESWEIIVNEETIETTVCGPIKVRYRRTQNVSEDERTENAAAMEAEAMAVARMIVAAPAMYKALTLFLNRLDEPHTIITKGSYFAGPAKTAAELIQDAIKDIE